MEGTAAKDGTHYADALDSLKDTPALGTSPFLGEGLSLRALIEHIRAERAGNDADRGAMARALQEALALQDKLPLSSSLYRGMPGIGWAIQLCPSLQAEPDSAQLLADLDELLLRGIAGTRSPNLDLINGIAGVMVYAVRRGRSSNSSAKLWDAIDWICGRAIRAWMDLSKSHALESRGTDFQRNLGIAHGVPGLLTMMVTASRRRLVSRESAYVALDGFEHLWAYSIRGAGNGALFPGFAGMNHATRLAWCYGALGLADAYRNASSLDGSSAARFSCLVEGALGQFLSGSHGIVDASLCHGSAGAHFYFDLFAQSACLSHQIREGCRRASAEAGSELARLNIGTSAAPSYLRFYRGAHVESSSFLAGTSGVVIAQNAVASRAVLGPWTELLGLFQSEKCTSLEGATEGGCNGKLDAVMDSQN